MKHKILRALAKTPLTADDIHKVVGHLSFEVTSKLMIALTDDRLINKMRSSRGPALWGITDEGRAQLGGTDFKLPDMTTCDTDD